MAQLIVWSALSLVVLLGGIGIMFAVYGRLGSQKSAGTAARLPPWRSGSRRVSLYPRPARQPPSASPSCRCCSWLRRCSVRAAQHLQHRALTW